MLKKHDGKQPVDNDRLTMLVSVSAKTGIHFFKRDVGIGSRSHCLSGKWLMRRQISTTVAGRKDVSDGGASSVDTPDEVLDCCWQKRKIEF